MKFRPLGDRVVVRRVEEEQKTAGGHQVGDVNLKEMGQNTVSRHDENKQDDSRGPDCDPKRVTPVFACHVTCKLQENGNAAHGINNSKVYEC